MKTTVVVARKDKGPSGQGQYGPWQAYYIFDGNEERFATFQEKLYDSVEVGKRYELDYDETDKGKKLNSLEEVKADETPKLGTGEYVTGRKPAIEALRIAALNAANQATALTAATIPGGAGVNDTKALWDSYFWHVFGMVKGAGQIDDPSEMPA